MKSTLDKSISQLEGWQWKDEVPSEDDSYVVRNFYRLHKVPLKNYTLGDIRFMIGQNSGLEYLVPTALAQMKIDVFTEADLYPGDLLSALLSINNEPNYWKTHPKEKQLLANLYSEQKDNLGSIDGTWEIIRHIKKSFRDFLSK